MFLEKVYTGKNQWYLYILSLLIIFTATQIGTVPLVLYARFQYPGINLLQATNQAMATNAGLALVLFSFLVGFIAIFLCAIYIHHKKCLDIITSRLKIDWGRFFFSVAIWGGLSILTFAIQCLFQDYQDIVFQFEPLNFFILVAVGLALFPFQTSFEEILFRGYLMQWSALLLKYRWAALLFTSILFGLMHAANPEVSAFGVWVALPQYILMGLILGYVTIKDNGLELALGLHFVNNFLAAVTFTSDASALQTHALFRDPNPTSSFWDILIMLVAGVIFIWICNRKYKFEGKVRLCSKINKPEQENNFKDAQ